MGFCSCTSKALIITINIVFLVGAAFLLYAGVAYLKSGDGVMDTVHSKPAFITFGISGLLLVSAIVGIAGAFSEKKVLLGIFTVVILGTLIMLVFVTAVLFVKEDKAMNETENFTLKQFNHYGSPNLTTVFNTEPEEYGSGNGTTAAPFYTTTATIITTTTSPAGQTNSTEFIDSIQKNLMCCGYNNYTDWGFYDYWTKTPSHKGKVPYSCCNKTAAEARNTTCPDDFVPLSMKKLHLIYNKGCKEEVNMVVNFVYKFMEWTALVFAVIVLLGFCATLFLMCRKRKSDGFNYSSIVA